MRLVGHYKQLYLDLETPVSAYMKLAREKSFLLESVTGQSQVARYSYIGLDPLWESTAGTLEQLETMIATIQVVNDTIPVGFSGGAVGFFNWETMAQIEPSLARDAKPSLGLPTSYWMIPSLLIAFDHATRSVFVVCYERDGDNAAHQKIADIEAILMAPLTICAERQQIPIAPLDNLFDYVTSTMSKDAFMTMVTKAKQYIYDGEAFQLVVSQRFCIDSNREPIDAYRALRQLNPSPYMFFMDVGEYQLVGASPEILVKCHDRQAAVRPIAGTRHRHAGEDDVLKQSLLDDDKETAEHLMLVDLGRNDLGRVCDVASVNVDQLMTFESYSHVIHMVSNVVGTLRDDVSVFDLIKATFPAGTLSGTPKINAIKLIDDMEPTDRGAYGGALGHIDFNGNMDLCIMIRTAVAKAGKYYVQAGAGIVADSDPESEFQESRSKAQGVLSACIGEMSC